MSIPYLWLRNLLTCLPNRSKPPHPNSQYKEHLNAIYPQLTLTRYCVRPNSGMIPPNGEVEVQGMYSPCRTMQSAHGYSPPTGHERRASSGCQMPRQVPCTNCPHIGRSRPERDDTLANGGKDRQKHHSREEDQGQLLACRGCHTQRHIITRRTATGLLFAVSAI